MSGPSDNYRNHVPISKVAIAIVAEVAPGDTVSSAAGAELPVDTVDVENQAARAGVYRLLSRLLYREPDTELLASLATTDGTDASAGPMGMAWTVLSEAVPAASSAAVREEYFELFIGVGRGELVPFGSWYLTGFLMEKPLAVLRRDLQQLGMERREGVHESEDHIAALCDAMAILIDESDGLDLARQQRFFDAHLQPWAPAFFREMQTARSARFYRAVGVFGQRFIEFEQRLLAMQG